MTITIVVLILAAIQISLVVLLIKTLRADGAPATKDRLLGKTAAPPPVPSAAETFAAPGSIPAH